MFFVDRVFGAGLLLLSAVIVVFVVVVVCIIVVVVAVAFFGAVPVLLLFVVDPYMFLCLFCFRFFLPHPCCCYCNSSKDISSDIRVNLLNAGA